MSTQLYIFCGIPFSGKSTVSKAVAKYKGYTRIDLDDIKFSLYGDKVMDANLKQKDWDSIYQAMYRQIEIALNSGETVIQDTGNFTRHERDMVRQIAQKQEQQTITVFVDTPHGNCKTTSLKKQNDS